MVRPLRGAATGKKRSKKIAPWKGAGESAAILSSLQGALESIVPSWVASPLAVAYVIGPASARWPRSSVAGRCARIPVRFSLPSFHYGDEG